MNIRIQIIVAVMILIALYVITNMVRKKRLELKDALAWMIVGVAVLVLDCFPDLIRWLSRLLGIASSINMLFFFGFCFSLIIIFVLTITVSKMSRSIKELTQALALFEKEERDQAGRQE